MALSTLWIRLVMNTVLPERLRPVTARLTVEPCAMSARFTASESHPDALATYGEYQGASVIGSGLESVGSLEYGPGPAKWKRRGQSAHGASNGPAMAISLMTIGPGLRSPPVAAPMYPPSNVRRTG